MNQTIDVAVQGKWKAIGPAERRVLGVLVEKSKTTPDIYPMTVNAIVTAANQKSNRDPIMQMTPEDVEETLNNLRNLGAVVEIQGDGRKLKYKHTLYQWMGVERAQLAVMAELLLRGAQTIGELRGRAARMERINDVAELKPILDGLFAANLLIPLTPEGRGQMITHNLYLPEELHQLMREYQLGEDRASVATSKPPMNQFVDHQREHALDGRGSGLQELHDQIESIQERLAAIERRMDALEQLIH